MADPAGHNRAIDAVTLGEMRTLRGTRDRARREHGPHDPSRHEVICSPTHSERWWDGFGWSTAQVRGGLMLWTLLLVVVGALVLVYVVLRSAFCAHDEQHKPVGPATCGAFF